jgi:hypothetical protein
MEPTGKVYATPFKLERMGYRLFSILLHHIDQAVPILQVGQDRMRFYPGNSFEGLVGNSFTNRSLARASKAPSGPKWFSIFLDADQVSWPVNYVVWEDGNVFVTTPTERFYWPNHTLGLARLVIRPLFMDWMLDRALKAEFGNDYLIEVAEDPALSKDYLAHRQQMAAFMEHFQIARPALHKSL